MMMDTDKQNGRGARRKSQRKSQGKPRKSLRALTTEEKAAVKKFPVKDEPELRDFVKLWRKGEMFFVAGVVNSPYDGCFYEPNIWLVAPPGSPEHTSLNENWSARYSRPKERLAALAVVNEKAMAIWREKRELERLVDTHTEKCGPDHTLISAKLPDGASMAEQRIVIDKVRAAMDRLRELEILSTGLKTENESINKRFPAKPELPPAVVFPLYASGQGIAVDVLWSLEDCLSWLHYGELPNTVEGETEEDGSTKYRDSRLAKESFRGTFDSFTVAPMGPISELPPAEHYWTAAVRIAEEQWSITLPWKCSCCDQVIMGTDEDESSPHNTGYRGNGGIGVFMDGALCADCFRSGCCTACSYHGGGDHDVWDQAVYDHGLSICQWHAEELGKLLQISQEEFVKLSELADAAEEVVLWLRWKPAQQETLNGFDAEWRLVLESRNGAEIVVQPDVGFDEFISRNDLDEPLDRRWGSGVYTLATHIARDMEPESEEDDE